jgi:hypothetical protein
VKTTTPFLILFLLIAACFSLAATIEPRAAVWSQGGESAGLLQVLLGDGRRIFANHFFVKADEFPWQTSRLDRRLRTSFYDY